MPSQDGQKLPDTYKQFVQRFPKIAAVHDKMADAVDEIGGLDVRTCALIKIGISMGAGLESALRSHVRKALRAGATRHEIEQAIFQGMNTIGFPRTVAAWSWANIQFDREEADGAGE